MTDEKKDDAAVEFTGEVQPSAGLQAAGQLQRTLTPSGMRKVPPNPDAPLLRNKNTLRRIEVADQKSAEAYDMLEDAKDKILALKEEIESGAIKVELEMSDTAVHRLSKI